MSSTRWKDAPFGWTWQIFRPISPDKDPRVPSGAPWTNEKSPRQKPAAACRDQGHSELSAGQKAKKLEKKPKVTSVDFALPGQNSTSHSFRCLQNAPLNALVQDGAGILRPLPSAERTSKGCARWTSAPIPPLSNARKGSDLRTLGSHLDFN